MDESDDIYVNCPDQNETHFSHTRFSGRNVVAADEDYEQPVSRRYTTAQGQGTSHGMQRETVHTKQYIQSGKQDSSKAKRLKATAIYLILVLTLVNTAMCVWFAVSFQKPNLTSSETPPVTTMPQSEPNLKISIVSILETISNFQERHKSMLQNLSFAVNHNAETIALVARNQEEMSQNISHSISRSVSRYLVCAARGGFIYSRGKCYIYHLNRPITYEQAETICSSNHSSLAEFEDMDQEIEVLDALKAQAFTGNPEFWIGMKYISSTGKVQYTSGTEVLYDRFKWHPGHPASQTHICVEVHKTDPEHYGFWDVSPSSTQSGALCWQTV